MKKIAFALAISTLCGIAKSAELPSASQFDNRIQYVNYNTGDVVIIRAVAGMASRIVFAPDEKILDVASGFTQGWEFSDRRNILYIKPKSVPAGQNTPAMEPTPGKWDTNLMIATNRRMYDFDLRLLPGSSSKKVSTNRVSYRVEFKYPADEAAAAKAKANKQATVEKLEKKPAPRNWNYSMQIGDASENIAPTMAYDDGRFTYLKFPNNRDLPAAFLVAPDGTESLMNSHVDPKFPDILVLHRVSKALVLRLGNAVVGVYNDTFDPDGIPAVDGTTVPGVQRVIKSGDEQ